MSYGKDERHIDKHIWNLPIALFDPANPDHQHLAALGQQQHDLVASLHLDATVNFVALRRQIRGELASPPPQSSCSSPRCCHDEPRPS